MEQTIDRHASEPFDSGFARISQGAHPLDVPGLLASRIGEMYATEERIHRKERTDRLIFRATHPHEE
jgi:hypothetical protein